MKKAKVLGAMVLAMVLLAVSGYSIQKDKGKENLSPYFAVQGSGDVESFPLLSTSADVSIAGMTAQTELKQVYKNDGKKTIEAIYVFPLGTKTAINAMKMQIGTRIIEADIHKTEEAQQIYNDAKNKGQTASLLEEKRPNVFQMSVANIMPGDKVEVTVSYTESLVPDAGVYEFMFPTVVGPRFTGEAKESDLKGKDNWTVNPYLHEGKQAPYEFSLKVGLKSGIPVAKVWSTSHLIETNFEDKNNVKITLAAKEKNGGNRDFILDYSLEGDAINTGTLLYQDKDEKYFLTMIEPPAKVETSMIPPREYLFIMDVSGSMYGFPLEISKKTVCSILSNLRGQDYFNVMFFSGGSNVLFSKPMPATEANRKKAVAMIENAQGSGGTEIIDAFTKASALPKKKGMSRIIVALTDGYVPVEKDVFDLIENKMGEANFFAFGIGTAVNRYIIEGMARVGKGEPFVVEDPSEAEQAAQKFINYIKSPVLTDIKVKYDGFDAYDVEPISVPDLFAERPLVISGKYKNASGKIIITGRTANGNFEKTINIGDYKEDNKNEAVKYLWAREKIARLADYAKVGVDTKEEVTALGLKYHLMTEFTSFVAVDKVVRQTGETMTVKQPLPLPQGVSDYAVGGKNMLSEALPAASQTRGYYNMGTVSKACKKAEAPVEVSSAEEKEVDEQGTKSTGNTIYISDGKTPSGYTLDEAEKAVFGAIKAELENFMQQWNLSGIEFELKVENGKVKEVKVLSYKGKEYKQDVLDSLFSKVIFDKVTGTIELTMEIM